jgi:hypothetical protein
VAGAAARVCDVRESADLRLPLSYDEFAPLAPDREQMRRFCAAGVKVDDVETVLGEHIAAGVTGAPGAVAYVAARFAGQSAPDNCSSIPAS